MAERTPVGKAASPTSSQPNFLERAASEVKGFFVPDAEAKAAHYSNFPGGKLPTQSPANVAKTQSTAPQTEEVVWGVDAQERFRQQLLDSSHYLPNPLNSILNPTYHIKFFVADIEEFRTNLGSSEALTFKGAIETMDQTSKIVIAESGVTAALNIQDLVFTQDMFQMGEKNAVTSEWKMTIREPVGTLFFDMLRNAVISIGAKTHGDYPYFVEISFKGYDLNGAPVNNILTELSNGGRFLHRVQILNIESNFDAGGATHVLTMQQVGYIGLEGESAHSQAMMKIEAGTVGEFFKQLESEMTKAQDTRYGTDGSSGHFAEFKFILKPFNGDDPANWAITTKEPEKNPSNMLSFENGKPTFNITPGMSISEIINVVFANTEQAQKYANSVVTQGETEESKDKTNAERFKDSNVMRVTPIVTETGFDPIARKYKRKFEYIIMMYNSQNAINSPRQVADAKDPDVQRKMINTLFDKGFLRKKYDYLYTGLNTEVLNLNISVNLQWTAVLPNLLGYRLNGPMVTQQAKYNDIATAQAAQVRVREAKESLEKAKAELNTAERSKSGNVPELEKNVAKAQEEFNQSETFARTSRDAVSQNSKQQDANPRSSGGSADTPIFAETLTETPTYDDLDPDVGITQAPAGADDDRGKGMAGQYHRDRGLYGALLDQIAGLSGGSMQDVEMEIRGDPFWLSRGNVEAEAYKSPNLPDNETPDLAKYLEGDNSFVLYVNYPAGFDENGNPVFRKFGDGTRKDTISAIYRVITVINRFEGGSFVQTIKAQRVPLISLAGAFGYKKAENEFGEVVDAGAAPPETPSSDSGSSAPRTAERATASQSKQQYMQSAYDHLRSKGYTHEGAKTMVAEMGRENNFNESTMFGTHVDAANGQTNGGIISWQKDRRTKLNKFMADRGFVNSDGTFVKSDASFRAQIDFMDSEIQTNPAYKRTKSAVKDPNLSYSSLEKVIGENYIAWDRAGNSAVMQKPGNLQAAFNTQHKYYNTISDLTDSKAK